MSTVFLKQARGQDARGAFARLRGMLRTVRAREADAIVAHYASGRLTDAAEREMTEKLLHRGDSFRF